MGNFWSKVKSFFTEVVIPKVTNIQWLEIPVSVYVRWILAVVLSVNTVLTFFGINPIPFSETMVYEIVTIVLNIAVLVVNTYKNNSTSKEALLADQVMRALKAAKTTDEETAIGKIKDILMELNGENYISEDFTEENPAE